MVRAIQGGFASILRILGKNGIVKWIVTKGVDPNVIISYFHAQIEWNIITFLEQKAEYASCALVTWMSFLTSWRTSNALGLIEGL